MAKARPLSPERMVPVGSVDERFQSFNVEMIEVTGGRFWKPYGRDGGESAATGAASASDPGGMPADLYEYRGPLDLTDRRLRKLAAALAPAYVRVSGTWANSVYFDDPETLSEAPAGFGSLLTRSQWLGVVDFSRHVGAPIVTSAAISEGTRDADGRWVPTQARSLFERTAAAGGTIAAAEFFNEPTMAAMGGAPPGYDAADFGRDVAAFREFLGRTAPNALLVGPGSVGEGGPIPLRLGDEPTLSAEDLLAAAGDVFDVFSYHYYGAVSERAASLGPELQTTLAAALTPDWLSRSGQVEAFYGGLRDRYAPGKPLWLTETADAGAGGNPWASSFIDCFRYLNQLGCLARRGVQVVAHNTLASSDYGLLDQETGLPRPNYWAAWLWRRLMGTTVLDPGIESAPNVYVYAHDLRGRPGGVAVLVINADREVTCEVEASSPGERFALTAAELTGGTVELNGAVLALDADEEPPTLTGERTAAGLLTFSPTTITFLAFADVR